MEDNRLELLKKHVSSLLQFEEGVIGLVSVSHPYPFHPQIDGLDLLLLVITSTASTRPSIEHLRMEGQRVMIRRTTCLGLEQWVSSGYDSTIIEWLMQGDIVFDKDGYLEQIKARISQFPDELMKRKLLVEYDEFLRSCLQAKQNLSNGHLLDAHNDIIKSLNHYAHMELIEAGLHPEPSVWRQMRRFHPGIYKLYEELTTSPETLEQRIQLVLLACEFSMMSKMRSCSSLIFHILESREAPWSVMELTCHPSLNGLRVDFSLILQKLVQRGYVREVAVLGDPRESEALELRYKLPR
jgi:hypothetical protein